MICPFCKQSVMEDDQLGKHLLRCQQEEAAVWNARFLELQIRAREAQRQEQEAS